MFFSLSGKNILIVDDQPNNLQVLFTFLQGKGLKVLVADSGKRALEQVERQVPDLVLMDVMMPGMDGFETCRRLKKDMNLEALPVIFMTALTDMQDKLEAFSAGGVDYVTKPFAQDEVLARITAHLKISDLQQQLIDENEKLEKALSEVKILQGIIPICSKCKMVRDDKGYWQQVETYVSEHAGTQFSHSYCPACLDAELKKLENM